MPKDPINYDLSIDLDRLHEEWQDQPRRFFAASVAYADAKKAAREKKAGLDLVRAELEASIRAEPEAYELPKVTEAAVAACIPQQREYKEALRAVHEADHEADVLGSFVAALETRRRALGDLVTLHGQGYFAEPRAKGPTRDLMEQTAKAATRQRGQRRRPAEDDDE